MFQLFQQMTFSEIWLEITLLGPTLISFYYSGKVVSGSYITHSYRSAFHMTCKFVQM